jgi:hypothetical protein
VKVHFLKLEIYILNGDKHLHINYRGYNISNRINEIGYRSLEEILCAPPFSGSEMEYKNITIGISTTIFIFINGIFCRYLKYHYVGN